MALSGIHRLGEYQECHSDSDRGEVEEEAAGEMEEEEAGEMEEEEAGKVEERLRGHDGINSRQILNTPHYYTTYKTLDISFSRQAASFST